MKGNAYFPEKKEKKEKYFEMSPAEIFMQHTKCCFKKWSNDVFYKACLIEIFI